MSTSGSDPAVLITGAAGGIGKATALRFAQEGWSVIAADIDEKGLEAFSGIRGVNPKKVDIRSGESVSALYEDVRKVTGTLRLVVNIAGIDGYFPFSEAPPECMQEILDINFLGACRINHAFIPMLDTPGGKIIHLGSESHHLTLPFMPYPLTKRILESYSMALRQEMRFRGIDVVIIRPGAVRTKFIRDLSSISYPVSDERLLAAFRKFTRTAPAEVGRTVEPERVAGLIYRVSQVRRPKAVYRINNKMRLRLASGIPYSLLEKAVFRKLK